MAAERLQKYLARAGVASRRHAEELITSGRVGVNNETVTELGSRVEPGTDLVTVDGKLVTPPEESSYYLLYKPVGVVTTLSDPQGRPTVANYLEETGRRLFPVGRLDYDAEGALLFTDDGALAHKLTHPSFQVPRSYLAKVKGVPDMPTLEKLRGGVRLEDGMATPVSVDIFEKAERNTWLKIVVAEGRPHLIKRLCAAVGHPVVRLFRPNYAGVGVEGLRPGELRPLKLAEVLQLTEVAEGRAQPAASELKLPPRRHGRSAPGFNGPDDDDVELSMDDDAPVAPRKTERAAKKAPTGPKTREARPERKEWKGVQDGGTRPPKFAKRGATLDAADDADADVDLEGVPSFDDDGEEVTESDAAEGATYGKAARGAGRTGKPARESAEGGASRGGGRFGKPAGAGRGGEDAPRGRFGKPAGRGGDEGGAPRGRSFGKPAGRGGEEGSAPRGRSFGKPAGAGRSEGGAPRGGSRFGGEEGGAPRGRSFGKPAGRFGAEGGAPRGRGFGKPAGAGRGGDDAPRGRSFGKPAGAGRGGDDAPRGRSFGKPAGRFGDEGGAPRGRGFGKPAGAGRGGDERAPRGRSFGGDEGGAPRGRSFGKPAGRFGDEGGAPRGRSFGKPAGAGRSEGGAPRGGSRFGGEEGGAPRGRSFGKPAGRFGDEGGAPRGRSFGKPAGAGRGGDERAPRGRSFGGDEGGAPRGRSFGKPAGRFGDEGGAPRGRSFGKPAGRFGKPAGAGRSEGGAPRGRSFGSGEGGAPRGGARFGKPAGRFGAEGGAPRGGSRFGKPAGAGGAPRGDRPERREWKPRGESAGRPERRDFKPRGEASGSRSRGGGESAPSGSGERIVRAGVKKAPPGESGGYQDFKERKTRDSEPRWSSKAPRGGAGRPPPRGGRSR
ncbi:pseudouridine synthase [Corallococcus carmarthensis]|uniref:Pseudouridine synthase n=1 Tax=Corallococcus carmarthensis TaxID=2316728 RepID=A0A3A8JS44_9BACT|nr:pseudouridine synthase [Corallococcus carmarthensis]RKG97788.1 pseudouridine synthase [Corallococcus carmarthensis]